MDIKDLGNIAKNLVGDDTALDFGDLNQIKEESDQALDQLYKELKDVEQTDNVEFESEQQEKGKTSDKAREAVLSSKLGEETLVLSTKEQLDLQKKIEDQIKAEAPSEDQDDQKQKMQDIIDAIKEEEVIEEAALSSTDESSKIAENAAVEELNQDSQVKETDSDAEKRNKGQTIVDSTGLDTDINTVTTSYDSNTTLAEVKRLEEELKEAEEELKRLREALNSEDLTNVEFNANVHSEIDALRQTLQNLSSSERTKLVSLEEDAENEFILASFADDSKKQALAAIFLAEEEVKEIRAKLTTAQSKL